MSKVQYGKVKVCEGKMRFTMHMIIFDPKKSAITSDEAKKIANTSMKISKARLKIEYDVIYAQAFKDTMGRKKVTMFKPCTKTFANCIFVVPSKWRKEAKKAISEYFF